MRQRFRNFPPSYQTHVINYPAVYATQSARITNPKARAFQQFAPTTTVQPIVKGLGPVEDAPAAIPSTVQATVPVFQAPIEQFNQDIVSGSTLSKNIDQTEAKKNEAEKERLLLEEQAKNARYTFGTSINDKINDHSIQRKETREGLALYGSYSYSDGYFKRTVHYEADQNGNRVVKEEIEPIGNGPQFNPGGTAEVTTNLHNSHISYSITADDYVRDCQNKTENVTEGKKSLNN